MLSLCLPSTETEATLILKIKVTGPLRLSTTIIIYVVYKNYRVHKISSNTAGSVSRNINVNLPVALAALPPHTGISCHQPGRIKK